MFSPRFGLKTDTLQNIGYVHIFRKVQESTAATHTNITDYYKGNLADSPRFIQ